jgi:hypothetical protein
MTNNNQCECDRDYPHEHLKDGGVDISQSELGQKLRGVLDHPVKEADWIERFNEEFTATDLTKNPELYLKVQDFIRNLLKSDRQRIAEEVGKMKKETTHRWCDAYNNHNQLIDKAGYCRDEVDSDNRIEGYNQALKDIEEIITP